LPPPFEHGLTLKRAEKRWAGFSDEKLCSILREADFYETMLLREHVDLSRINEALETCEVKLPRARLVQFLRSQGVGFRQRWRQNRKK